MKLQVIEKNNERVLLTSQIAESYGTTAKVITDNFSNNKKRYVEGKHFYCLTGEELKEFKNQTENFGLVNKHSTTLYLWTQKGALLHAKSLGTDKAWEVYDYLVDSYFQKEKAAQIPKMSVNELILEMAKSNVETEKRIKTLEVKQQAIEERTEKVLDVFTMPNNITWHEAITSQFKKICYKNNLNYQVVLGDLYKELESEVGCDLTARQRNKRKRMKLAGCTHAQVIKETSKIMLIEDDDALRLAFENIFRKFQVRYLQGDNVQEYI